MRIVLRGDMEQFTIVRAFEVRDAADVREFTSEHVAMTFLHRFLGSDAHVQTMRRELESSRETADIMRMSDIEVFRSLAVLLASGLLKIIVDAIAPPIISLGFESAKGKAEPGKAPPIDHKPAPIVPQEYPILARVESNEVVSSTRRLVADLQSLLHVLFNRNLPASQVAAEYISTAKEVAADARRAIERLQMSIERLLHRTFARAPQPSAIALELATLGKTEGKLAGQIITSFAASFKSLLWQETERPTDEGPRRVLRGVGTSLRGGKAQSPAAPITHKKKPDAPEELPKTSVVFKVMWGDSGKPVPSVSLKIKMPSGNETELRTNNKGEIRLAGIQAGDCEVRSDIKGATRRDVLEVGGSGGGADEGPGGGSTKYKLAKIERYKVKTGDTLDSIAAKAGIRASDLAKFNWGTDDPKRVSQSLHLEVGCTKKSPDGKSYIFDDADSPGIVLLPRPLEEVGLATGGEHVFSVAKLTTTKKWVFSM
jgi:hypothetical protein